uniref:Tyrosine-protein kinase ephrin type A/B receptor-like domain-containing protein n=1 Tax=Globisporangium ultimum (strain ATCC 200006 / CBS 805.95 / DAOM BR144) TaxID=431595 RepID=K3W9N6_GLOUD
MCKPCECAPGTTSTEIAAKDRKETCVACPPAHFSMGFSDQCHKCPLGKYADEKAAHCHPLECPPGYTPNEGALNATDCSPCPIGTFSTGGVSFCDVLTCEPGHYAHEYATTGSDCSLCELGTFSAGGNVSSCSVLECPAGTMAKLGATNATDCVPCSGGMVSKGGSSLQCELCELGQYAKQVNPEDLGASECAPAECSLGYAAWLGATTPEDDCAMCEYGNFSIGGEGQCSIMICPPGTQPRSPAGNATDCDGCEIGWYAQGGTTFCQPTLCPVGYEPNYNASDPVSFCSPCPHGMTSQGNSSLCGFPLCIPGYEPNDNGTSCNLCAVGSYSAGNGTFCTPTECPTGSMAFAGAVHEKDDCVACNATYFSPGGNATCEKCASGTYPRLPVHDSCAPLECEPGHEPMWEAITANDCSVCKQGYFSPGGNAYCRPAECERGYFAPEGAANATSDCTKCPVGQYSLGGQSACKNATCKPGFAAKAGARGPKRDCEPCGAGYWGRGNATASLEVKGNVTKSFVHVVNTP